MTAVQSIVRAEEAERIELSQWPFLQKIRDMLVCSDTRSGEAYDAEFRAGHETAQLGSGTRWAGGFAPQTWTLSTTPGVSF